MPRASESNHQKKLLLYDLLAYSSIVLSHKIEFPIERHSIIGRSSTILIICFGSLKAVPQSRRRSERSILANRLAPKQTEQYRKTGTMVPEGWRGW